MKKTAIFMLAMLPAMMGWAQDTVDNLLLDGYFYNNLPSLNKDNIPGGSFICGDNCGILTKEMYTPYKEPITIYGVAAAMSTPLDRFYIPDEPDVNPAEWWWIFFDYYGDTSTADLYEYLGVYLRSGDSLVPHRELMVHRRYDTPAYYINFGLYRYNPNFCYPMYEKYFDSPITVLDTFYMGTTERTSNTWDHPLNMGFELMSLHGQECRQLHEYHVWKYCYPEYTYWNWPLRQGSDDMYLLIFPILTPNPDTTGTGGDTLAVTQADMVGRYVSVQPNPAVDEARVLSSFGLERIEAYNAEGRLVFKQEAAGLEATLDVKGWPRGTYLLRIQTPMGVVTKKLLVQ